METKPEANEVLPGRHIPLWIATTPATDYPSLSGSFGPVDVAVIGGGITGLTTAALMQEVGLSVAVFEAKRIASGVTGHTTAKITSQHGLFYDYLTSQFGKELASLYAAANETAMERLVSLIRDRKIDCNLTRKAAYTYAASDKNLFEIAAEVKATEDLGLPVSFVEHVQLPFETKGAICFANQAQFHPRKYLLALAGQLASAGCSIFENTRAREIREQGDICEVITPKGSIRARHVIVASHFPMQDPGFYFARMYPNRSYAMAARLKGLVPDGMFYGSSEPHYSLRSQPMEDGSEIAVFSGLGHKTGHGGSTIEMYRQLAAWIQMNFDVESIDYCWSTQDNVTIDEVAYIGKLGPGFKKTYVATGFNQWGMTQSMVAAIIISDAVLGRTNPWTEVYDPNRLKRVKTAKLITENVHAVQHLVINRIISPESFDVKDLKPHEGGVIRHKLGQVAVARDSKGILHSVSPSCVHMGCLVSWNDAEESWDCPCHGSRYEADGTVIHGPAQEDLERKLLD